MNIMTTSTETRKLRRSATDRQLAGVCGGWARLLGVDATILRIGFVVATICGVGAPILLYGACCLLMPEED
jgi:phage shock protein C